MPGISRVCGSLSALSLVGDQMHREGGGKLAVEMVEKADELLMPVARLALGDDRAIEHVEGREPALPPD
jgi:hypothetical protein